MSAYGLYTLDEAGNAVPATDALEWAAWMEVYEVTGERRLGNSMPADDVRVSTVFVGVDMGGWFPGWESHDPLVWETMVFGGVLDGEQERYRSKSAALAGHEAMVGRVRRAHAH